MNLFAYGTLMAVEGLREVLGPRADALAFRPARLPGWRRIWNVFRPEWNGGVLNLEASPGDVVVGMLIEGLGELDLQLLDAQEATHLPRETVYVEPFTGDVVPAQIYRRRKGNHAGKPSGRYRTVVLERAYRAGWEVYENLCRGTVDAGETRSRSADSARQATGSEPRERRLRRAPTGPIGRARDADARSGRTRGRRGSWTPGVGYLPWSACPRSRCCCCPRTRTPWGRSSAA